MKFAALGRTHWLYDSIRRCVKDGHEVTLIGTSKTEPEYKVSEHDFKALADELECPFFCDPRIEDQKYLQMLRDSNAEIAISINWLTRLSQSVLETFKYGVINAHAGDLPRFRGNAAPNWAMVTNEKQIALIIHQMDKALDAGSIFLKRTFPLTPMTYIADVYQFMTENIPEMFAEVLRQLEQNNIIPEPQPDDPELSLRCFPRLPHDSEIDWRLSAENLARLVRASAEPFSGAYTFNGNERLTIWRAHQETLPFPFLGMPGQIIELRRTSGEVSVLTGDGVLVLEEIETEKNGRCQASDVLRSTRLRLGLHISKEIEDLNSRITHLETFLVEQLTFLQRGDIADD